METFKKFAVAYLNLHDGELKLEFVEAETKVDAALKILPAAWSDGYTYQKLSTLQSDVMDSDGWLEVKEILS